MLLKNGGKWLGSLRSRVQTNFRNGDKVTFGSNDILLPHATIRDVEELGRVAVVAELKERLVPIIDEIKKHIDTDDKFLTSVEKLANGGLSEKEKMENEKLFHEIYLSMEKLKKLIRQATNDL